MVENTDAYGRVFLVHLMFRMRLYIKLYLDEFNLKAGVSVLTKENNDQLV